MAVSVGSPICFSSPSMTSTVPFEASVPRRSNDLIPREASSDISSGFPFIQAFMTVILFWVRVPVLSEQITDALPSVSTAGSCRMMAFFSTMRWTPRANTTVTMAGNPSGMAATANETAVMKISRIGIPT